MDDKIRTFLQSIDDPQYIKCQLDSLSSHDTLQYRQGYGLVGMENLGNTCYLNSILQCLRHTIKLNQILLDDQPIINCENTDNNRYGLLLLCNYIKIIQLTWKYETVTLTPIGFKILLGKTFDQFNDNAQHDSHEVLINLLQLFHDLLADEVEYQITGTVQNDTDYQIYKAHADWIAYYKDKDSSILDIFSGQLKNEIMCIDCHHTSLKYDPFMVLDLFIHNNSDLYACIQHFSDIEQFEDNNMYQCEHCHNATRALKKHTFWQLPKILIIKFNRFQYTTTNGHYRSNKIDTFISYPVVLNLDQKNYSLYAVNCHVGTMDSGHYYSICLNHTNNQWIIYNDDHKSTTDQPVVKEAYILFYQLVQ